MLPTTRNQLSSVLALQASSPSMSKGLIVVSIEGGFFATIGDFFLEQGTKFKSYITDISKRVSDTLDSTDDTATAREFAKATYAMKGLTSGKISFVDIMDRETPIIMGLSVDYATLNKDMIIFMNEVDRDMIKYAERLSFTMSKFMTSQDYRRSFKNRTSTPEMKAIKDFNERAQAFLSRSFDARSTSDRTPIKNVVHSMSDIEKVVEDTKVFSKKIDLKKLGKVEAILGEIGEKTDTMISWIDSEEKKLEVTKETLEELVAYMDEVARYVTYSATIVAMANMQVGAVTNMIKIIEM